MMHRRAFVGALGLLAMPLGAGAQQAARVPRIGSLSLNRTPNRHLTAAFNLKTAKTLGLTIPPSLLQRADQVIQ